MDTLIKVALLTIYAYVSLWIFVGAGKLSSWLLGVVHSPFRWIVEALWRSVE